MSATVNKVFSPMLFQQEKLTTEQQARYKKLHDGFITALDAINENCNVEDERAKIAVERLKEASMWANTSIKK